MLSHNTVFEALKALVGTWQGQTKAGRFLSVTYTLHARDTVLKEHWQLNPTTDALTLYNMDDAILMATHYCPLCNQPRLNLVHQQGSEFGFEFVSATNLTDLSKGHQHSFQFRLIAADVFWRSETYLGKGAFIEGITYQRSTG